MTHRMIRGLVTVGLLASVSAWVNAQAAKTSPVEGAWVLQDYTFAKPPAALVINKPTGLMLFTGNHFSLVFLRDSTPRQVTDAGTGSTDEQMRASWASLQAQAGTYEISGDKLTLRPSVSKAPGPMARGGVENTFTLKGDILELVSTGNQTGAPHNPRTLRLVRAK